MILDFCSSQIGSRASPAVGASWGLGFLLALPCLLSPILDVVVSVVGLWQSCQEQHWLGPGPAAACCPLPVPAACCPLPAAWLFSDCLCQPSLSLSVFIPSLLRSCDFP